MRRLVQGGVDQVLEVRETHPAADGLAIDEEVGGPSTPRRLPSWRSDSTMGLKRWVSRSWMNLGMSRLNCAALATGSSHEFGLRLEQEVVHLPELALVAGGGSSFVGQRAFFVHWERVVFDGESHLRGTGGQELAHHRLTRVRTS